MAVLSDEWELASDCLFVIRARLLLYESDLIRIERRMALRAILDLHWVQLACLATQHSWRQSICLGPRVLPSAFGLSTAQRCGIRLCASVGRVGGRFCRSYHRALCGWHYILGLSRYICLAGGHWSVRPLVICRLLVSHRCQKFLLSKLHGLLHVINWCAVRSTHS